MLSANRNPPLFQLNASLTTALSQRSNDSHVMWRLWLAVFQASKILLINSLGRPIAIAPTVSVTLLCAMLSSNAVS